jgi:hypothetical protein
VRLIFDASRKWARRKFSTPVGWLDSSIASRWSCWCDCKTERIRQTSSKQHNAAVGDRKRLDGIIFGHDDVPVFDYKVRVLKSFLIGIVDLLNGDFLSDD